MLRVEIDPEVPERRRRLARDPADERDDDGHARRGADEVLHREGDHLREVAHASSRRRSSASSCCVDEADGRVPREVRRRRGEALRVERQERPAGAGSRRPRKIPAPLKSSIADGVRRPVGLLVLLHAGEAIEEPLDGADDLLEQDRLALVDARHVRGRAGRPTRRATTKKRTICKRRWWSLNFSGLSRAKNRYTSSASETTPPTT